MLRLFAIHAEATSVRLRKFVELTRQNAAALIQELDWLPQQVMDIGQMTSVEADRLSVLAATWRADADLLEGPDGPTDDDLRNDDFLSSL